jgi:ubiquinone biosynthesis protein
MVAITIADTPRRKELAMIITTIRLARYLKNGGSDEQIILGYVYRMGFVFVKLGQILSMRGDIIGDKLAKTLTQLQDKVPPFELRDELPFKLYEKTPIASASISQLHVAYDDAGNKYAVKVQRPNIKKVLKKEMRRLKIYARSAHFFSKRARKINLRQMACDLDYQLRQELSFKLEAASIEQLRKNSSIIFPEIDYKLSTNTMLIYKFIEGEKLTESTDKPAILMQLAATCFRQIYEDGFFHADLHLGNLLATPNNQLAMLDFGIIGFLSEKNRYYIVMIMDAFLREDYDAVARLHFDAGFITKEEYILEFAKRSREIGQGTVTVAQSEINSAKILKQLLDLIAEFDMPRDSQLFVLHKTILQLEGIIRMLDGSQNFFTLCKPQIKSLMLRYKLKDLLS